MIRFALALAPLLLFGSLTAACGGGGSSGNTVAVELNEWSVKPAMTTLPSGRVTLQARNTGTIHHELRVSRKSGDQQTLVGLIETFDPNQTRSREFNLTPGTYELSCQLADQQGGQILNHYALGMHTEVTVQ